MSKTQGGGGEDDRAAQVAIEFADRMKGTLPEQITANDLETLNAGLRFLFGDLRTASALFHHSKNHGRDGAIKAVGAAWRLVALFKQPHAELLPLPLVELQDALTALDNNNVVPILKPIRRKGRAVSSGARAALKGRGAGAVAQLMEAGLSRQEACTRVATLLVKLGVRPERGSGQVTATTVRHWFDEVAADVGRRGEAAIVYHDIFTAEERERFSKLPSDQARRSHALASLTAFVLAVFPELRPNPVKPPI
jgi:hypothetical protein